MREQEPAADSAFSPMPVSPGAVQEWCAGLPLAATRQLTPNERLELEREAKGTGCFKWGCALSLVPLLGLFAMAAIAELALQWIGGGAGEIIAETLPIIFLVAWMIALACGLLRGKDLSQLKRASRLDLAENRLSIYQGAPPHFENLSEENKERWELSPWISAQNVANQHKIEVLTRSRRLWSVDGQRVTKHLELAASTLAQTPPNASVAAAWAPAISNDAPVEFQSLNRRALSQAECEELQRHARRWKKLIWPAVLFSAWIGIPLTLHLASSIPLRVEPMAYVVAALALWSVWNLLRAFWQSQQFQRDIGSAEVVIVRLAEPQNGVQWVEILPISQLEWTLDGRAAPWRHSS